MGIDSRIKTIEERFGYSNFNVNNLTFTELMHPDYFHCEDKVERINKILSSMTKEERRQTADDYYSLTRKIPAWTFMNAFYNEFHGEKNEMRA